MAGGRAPDDRRDRADDASRSRASRAAPSIFGFVPALDGIRAVAVLGVMLYHGGAPLAVGRLPRRQHVLRPVGIPHHLAPAGRVGPSPHHPARPVLGPPGPAAAAGPAPPAGRRGRLRPLLRHPRRVRQPPPRLAVDAVLRGQLALHRRRVQLLRRSRPAVPALPHVVAGDRGAVLHRVAAGGPGAPPPGPPTPPVPPTVAGAGRRGGRGALASAADMRWSLPARRLGHPAVRRDRHPVPGHPGRRGAGHRAWPCGPGTVGPCPLPVPDLDDLEPARVHPRPAPSASGAPPARRRDAPRRRGPSIKPIAAWELSSTTARAWPPSSSVGPRSSDSWSCPVGTGSTGRPDSCSPAASWSWRWRWPSCSSPWSPPRRARLARALANPVFVYLGKISYGLYLWHFPLFSLLDAERMHLYGLPLLAVRLGVTMVVATASYYLVELPIRQGRMASLAEWRGWLVTSGAFLGVVAVTVAATLPSAAEAAGPLPAVGRHRLHRSAGAGGRARRLGGLAARVRPRWPTSPSRPTTSTSTTGPSWPAGSCAAPSTGPTGCADPMATRATRRRPPRASGRPCGGATSTSSVPTS